MNGGKVGVRISGKSYMLKFPSHNKFDLTESYSNSCISEDMEFKSGQQKTSPNPAKAWAKLPNTLEQANKRLQGVQIECLDAKELIKRYNTKDVFIYCDPPYLLETRKSYLYKHEMTNEEHIEKFVLHIPKEDNEKFKIY